MGWTDETIRTERLRLRPFGEADRPTVTALLTDPDVREFLGGPATLPDDFASYPLGRQWGVWGVEIVETAKSIGSCSLKRDRGSLEISYTFLPESWGHGYAYEACRAVLDWIWRTTSEAEAIAVTQTSNARSLALLGRLGFRETERFEEFDAEQSLQTLGRPQAG